MPSPRSTLTVDYPSSMLEAGNPVCTFEIEKVISTALGIAAYLVSVGNLSAAAGVLYKAQSILDSTSNLSAVAKLERKIASALSGNATLESSVIALRYVSSSMSSYGTLGAIATVIGVSTGTNLIAIGSLDSVASVLMKASSSMVATSGIEAVSKASRRISSSISGSGDIDASAKIYKAVASSMVGNMDIQAIALAVKAIQAAMTAQGDISASAKADRNIQSAMISKGTMTSTSKTTRKILSALASSASIAIAASGTFSMAASLVSPTSLSITATVTDGGGVPAYTDVILSDAPVAYFIMDEDSGTVLVDETGNYDMALVNSPTLGEPSLVSGVDNSSISFNGVNQYAEIDSALGITAYPFTFEAWVVSDNPTASGAVMSIVDTGSASRMWALWIDENGIAKALGRNNKFYVNGTVNVGDGNPHHIVAVFEGPESRSIYVDGVFDSEGTGAAPFGTMNRASIGRLGDSSPSSYYNGTIQHAAIYDRGLSLNEIESHYDNGT